MRSQLPGQMPGNQVADRLARLNRRVFNPVIRTFAGRRPSPVSIVVHRGRRSGRHYRTPVISFRVANGYLVSLPYGAHRDWVRNVMAAGACTLERGGRQFQLTSPTLLTHGEGTALLPAPLRPLLHLVGVTEAVRLSTPS